MRFPLSFLFSAFFIAPLFSINPPPVDCDTVLVVAQATAGNLTCVQSGVDLTGAIHTTALSYAWTGPQNFASDERVALAGKAGTYLLTVTGPYGCTAQTSVTVNDDCTFYPLVPPACPGNDAFYPPSESCPEACVRPFIPKGYQYSTAGYQDSGTPPGGFCSEIKNDQWWAFVAGATFGTITAVPSNCSNGTGIQIALYPACGEAPVACNGGSAGFGNTPVSISPTGLTIGKVYYLMVNGYEGDLCDFEFAISNNICNFSFQSGSASMSGRNKVCPNATASYSLTNPPFATAYLWTGPPGSSINGQPSPAVLYVPASNSVNVTFGTQSGFVSVRALNYFSPPSEPISFEVEVKPLPKTIHPPVTICNEDLPYTLPWGALALASGTYTDTLTSYLGCDSIVEKKVIVKGPYITQLGTKTLCEGQCFEINGTQYCNSGTYSEVLTSYLGCDSLVVFTLKILDPVAKILGASTLTCTKTSVTLNSEPSAGNKIWLDGSGSVVGSGGFLTVTKPGMYVLVTTLVSGGVTCIKRDTVFIPLDAMPPSISPTGGTVTCSAPTLILQNGAATPPISYFWTGPNGFSSTLSQPVVSAAGIYTLIATRPNGCTASATATVVADQATPGASASAEGQLTCVSGSIQLTGSSPTPFATFFWTGPDGFSSTLSNPTVNVAGVYTVVATAANGCSSTATAIISADQALPELIISSAIINCITSGTILEVSSSVPLTAYNWTGPNGFSSNQPSPMVSAAGEYVLTATAANGCPNTANVLVTADQALPVVTISDAVLNCILPGTVLEVNADVPLSTYTWIGPNGFSSSEPSPSISIAGEYTLIATAANGCQSTVTATVIADQTPPWLDFSDVWLSCTEPGTVLFVGSDVPIAAYAWTGPGGFFSNQIHPFVSEAGEYALIATANNGCTSMAAFNVIAPPLFTAFSMEVYHPVCSNQSNGALWASIEGGTMPYHFLWSNGATVPDISGLSAGVYSLTVTDQKGCVTSTSVALADIDDQSPTVTALDATLSLAMNGNAIVTLETISVQVADNCSVPSTLISPSSFDCTHKGPQTVTVTATDEAGLTASVVVTVTIVDDQSPMLTCPANMVTCLSDNIVSYQEPAISDNCSLAGGLFSQIQGLPSGAPFPVGTTTQIYAFTDASGNTGACSFDVTVTSPVVFDQPVVTNTTSGQSNGAIDLTVSGGAAPYSFVWTMNGQPVGNTEDLIGLPAGVYEVQVTDAEGCTYTLTEIEVKSVSSSTVPVQTFAIRVMPNPMSDEARIEVLGAGAGWGNFRLQVFDLQGSTVRDLSAATPVFVLKKETLPVGMYFFQVLLDTTLVGCGKLVCGE